MKFIWDSPVSVAVSIIGLAAWGIFCYFFAQLFHELGRIIAGWCVGYRFKLIKIGGMLFVTGAEGLQFRFTRSLRSLSGSYPVEQENILPRTKIIIWGGLVASGLLVLAAWASFEILDIPSRRHPQTFYALSLPRIAATIALVVAGLELAQRSRSEARILERIRPGSDSAKSFEMLIKLLADVDQGKRPREWNIEAIDWVERMGTPGQKGVALYHKSVYLYDMQRTAEAMECLKLFIDKTSSYYRALRNSAAMDLAYLQARSGDAVEARNSLQLITDPNKDDRSNRRVAEAAIAFAEGQLEEAAELARCCENTLRRVIKHWTPLHDFRLECIREYCTPITLAPPDDDASR